MKRERTMKLNKNGVNAYMPAVKKTKTRKIVWTLLALATTATLFFGGAVSVWFSLDREIRTLVKVKDTIEKQYYQEITDEAFYDAVFEGVNGLLDPYSQYMTGEEYAQSANNLNGRRMGMGVSLYTSEIEKGRLKIAKVGGNSPAERAGLVAGSYIVGYGKTETEIAHSVDYDGFVAFLRGFSEGELFYLQVQTAGETCVVPITQETYVENYVFYRSNDTSYAFTGENANELTERNNPLPRLPKDTAYIRLTQFGGEAVESFGIAMSVFKHENKQNLVLDLRGNGGGYLRIMQRIASYFCKGSKLERPVAAIADYGEKKEIYYATANKYAEYFSENSRICILADSGSASASECLIGVAVDYGAVSYADICLIEREGVAKTYGKGIMQSYFPLGFAGDTLKLTTAEIRWPLTEYSIHGRGILPEDGTKTVRECATDEEELTLAIDALFA